MTETERLEVRIDKNEEKLNALSTRVAEMDTRCGERHKISLTTQLKTFEVKTESFEEHTKEAEIKLQKEIQETQKTVNSIQIGMEKNCKNVTELLDQLQMRVKTLEGWKLKKESFKQKLWFEIILMVVSFFVLSFLTHYVTDMFNHNSSPEKTNIVMQQIQK